MLLAYVRLNPNDADLLGTPLGDMSCIDNVLSDKVNKLKILGDRLGHLYKQDALLLIRSAFSMPKILYLLRTAPCFSSPVLDDFDKELRSILSTILNLSLDDENVWIQATLPINSGGLGGPTECSAGTFCLSGFCYCLCSLGHTAPAKSICQSTISSNGKSS